MHAPSGDNDDDEGPPLLVDGILQANAAELAMLLHVARALMANHHGGIDDKLRPLTELAELVHKLGRGQVDWIDLDEPGKMNPDGPDLRSLLLDTARASILQAVTHCVSMQRRVVTGRPYGHGVPPSLGDRARADPHARWTRYAPVPEAVVEALVVYARQHDNLHLAGVVGTLDTAEEWRSRVLPDIRQHYARTITTHAPRFNLGSRGSP